VGFLAHDLFLYPELSAAENLSFFARLHRVSDTANAVDTALRQSNLHERRDDPVMTFSRGMRQRLAIERALLHAPRLVLLDEPFTGLDDAAVAATRTRLSTLRDAGCIVLLTTHDLEAVEPIVDRAVVLAGGRLNAIEKGEGGLRAGYRRLATS
jgi:ABC-type multidrug transport system ATPase subunit